jgi:iron complex transport system ATP-binding protein
MYYVRHSLRQLVQSGKSLILVTHYPEDVIPEISRLVMIKDGFVFADGPKDELMTSARMSALFDVPMEVRQEDGYYQLVARY